MMYTTKLSKLLAFLFLLATISIHAQKKNWKIDQAHSKIGFSISYFKVGEIKGVFDNYKGTFTNLKDQPDNYSVKITINTASINTNQKKRDEHLRSNDFFDAEKHPDIVFESISFKKLSNESYEVKGNFTMSGITKPLTLKAIYKGSYVHPRFKNTRKFFTILGKIAREDFNVGTNYKPAKFALGQDVDLVAEIHLIEE